MALSSKAIVVILSLSTYAAWWCWFFLLKPWLFPNQPRELPYVIPILGHALTYIKDDDAVIQKARRYFQYTDEPFFLTLGGHRLYFVTSPAMALGIYKNPKLFSFDEIVRQMTTIYGVSLHGVHSVYEKPLSKEEDAAHRTGYVNPKLKCMAHLNSDYLKAHLNPGEQLGQLLQKTTDLIHKSLVWDELPKTAIMTQVGKESSQKRLPWYSWSRMFVQRMTASTFFGYELLKCQPNVLFDFIMFDEDNYKLWYKIPGADFIIRAKERVIDAIEAYIALPENKRSSMAPLVVYYEKTCREKGLSERDTATILSMLYLGQNTNTATLVFWIMSYAAFDNEILRKLKEEISAGHTGSDDHITVEFLQDSCPLLNASVNEALRLSTSSASARTTTKSTVIGGKEIPQGVQIVMPFRNLHHNVSVWGPQPGSFDPARFLKDPKLEKSQHYRPFGGGVSLCPGRFIAKSIATLTIALALQRFDLRLDEQRTQRFPRRDTRPSIGLAGPLHGDELYIVGYKGWHAAESEGILDATKQIKSL